MVATLEELCSQMRPHYGLRKLNLNLRCFVNQILDESGIVLAFVEATMLILDREIYQSPAGFEFPSVLYLRTVGIENAHPSLYPLVAFNPYSKRPTQTSSCYLTVATLLLCQRQTVRNELGELWKL